MNVKPGGARISYESSVPVGSFALGRDNMPLQGLHVAEGMLVVGSDGEQVLFDGDSASPPPVTVHPPIATPTSSGKPRKGPIVLGPIEGPPLPMSVVSSRVHERKFVHIPMLQLDSAISNGAFNERTKAMLLGVARHLPHDVPLTIDANLPEGYGVNLDLLSRHVAALGVELGRNVSMTLTLPKAGE